MLEIQVPDTKPATEWIHGRPLQKMTPRERHARAQLRFAGALLEWADKTTSGRVGTEWDFRIAPPGEQSRPLVPDVAYVSYERVPFDDEAGAQIPRVAPNVVVEILSPGDLQRDVDEKVRVYLAAGTDVVFIVHPLEKLVEARDPRGTTFFNETEVLRHPALPGFAIDVSRLFFTPKPPSANSL